MSYISHYTPETLSREEVDQTQGPMVLEFGANWCAFCQGAQPDIKAAIDNHPDVQHMKVEDGKGRRLGRTFGVKLWPALILLKDGHEVGRVVRPGSRSEIEEVLSQIEL
ncbi:thioredoxin family protein [Marinobacter sp. CHS3-4]|uniref:thioredoxin family protein n=1 Tax=Marinobacter sp. CHS3-4 TaxID=3045174 RepID=UPI0024B4BF41|nr:thioredoxin family protein [Marinobacter sp. CHS3-4]MDI9246935.1 thioredoxin family protein [Marinobacter sp. CHS3-4]